MLKINRLETHDRYQHFMQDQSEGLAQGAEACLKTHPIAIAIQQRSPYVYLFAHPRTADDGVTKRMLWQPRISRPSPQTNSYLFRAQSNTDLIEICWLLPPREMWKEFEKGKGGDLLDHLLPSYARLLNSFTIFPGGRVGFLGGGQTECYAPLTLSFVRDQFSIIGHFEDCAIDVIPFLDTFFSLGRVGVEVVEHLRDGDGFLLLRESLTDQHFHGCATVTNFLLHQNLH